MRFAPLTALLILAWGPLWAQSAPAGASGGGSKRPPVVDPAVMMKEADALRDSVADPSVSDVRLHEGAAALFQNTQSQTPVVRPDWTPVDRENVDGHVGTIDGMIATGQERFAQYRDRFHESPPPDLVFSVQMAESLRAQKREAFDKTGSMAENQMGVFRYATNTLAGGVVSMNRRMALIATRIGEAFAFATLVHEATHARDREAGRLDPQHEIDAEMNAFRVQYLWLTTMDPSGMRMIVLRSTLNLWLDRHPEDAITAQSVKYLDHLIGLWETGGDKDKLREFVNTLGYEDDPDRAPPAAAHAPAPVRA